MERGRGSVTVHVKRHAAGHQDNEVCPLGGFKIGGQSGQSRAFSIYRNILEFTWFYIFLSIPIWNYIGFGDVFSYMKAPVVFT